MSATNRGKARNANDFYVTPESSINSFLDAWNKDTGVLSELPHMHILDPCAGGYKNGGIAMPYPKALQERGASKIETIDLRENSLARVKGNYLTTEITRPCELIISNPPFSAAQEFVIKALQDVEPDGHVVFMLRLNFLGTKKRFEFWQQYLPTIVYVHSKRPSFSGGGTDATEYGHFVWHRRADGKVSRFAGLRVIE